MMPLTGRYSYRSDWPLGLRHISLRSLNGGIVGSNPTRGMDLSAFILRRVVLLRRADPPFKESYRMYID
jgi:hypothetical protein